MVSSPHNHPIHHHHTLGALRPDTLARTLANDQASHSLNLSLKSPTSLEGCIAGREAGRALTDRSAYIKASVLVDSS